MQYTKYLAGLALAGAMLFPGAAALSAQDWRDLHHDYNRADRMSDDMARDRARLDEDIRCGRQEAAARDARDLARDQRAYAAQVRDIRRDQYRGQWRYRYDYRRDWR